MPSWLRFATHLAERRGLFAKNPLSQIQDFLLKVDMALTKPLAESKHDLALLRRDIGLAYISKGADPKKVFPNLPVTPRAARVQGEEVIDRDGPIEVVSTMTAAEALADIELLLKAERTGTMTVEDLAPITESTNGDHQPD